MPQPLSGLRALEIGPVASAPGGGKLFAGYGAGAAAFAATAAGGGE